MSPVDAARLDSIPAKAATSGVNKPCICIPEGATLTYGDLETAVAAFSHYLKEHGGRPGDRLVIASCNSAEFFIALFGAMRAGMIAVPLDAALSQLELKNVVTHCAPVCVVVDDPSASAFQSLDIPTLVLRGSSVTRAETFLSPPSPPDCSDVAMITYTSGTTGAPKGVMHSHAAMLHKVEVLKQWFGLDESFRVLCFLPTHFGHPLVASCLSTLNAGGTLVLTRPFEVGLLPRLASLLERQQITTFSTVPTIVRLLLRYFESSPPPRGSALRYVTCASAPLRQDELEAFERRFGVPLLNCYGVSEAGTWSAMSPRDPKRDKRSVGIQAGSAIRAVDRDRNVLPPGETGELEISGPSIMRGYYANATATSEVLRDGWLATGDLGTVDESGRVFLAGRCKDLIIRAGANIFPGEVESVLTGHPKVAEAYVVGLDDPILGEAVGAVIICKAGATLDSKQLLEHCRDRLAQYKWPQEIRFLDAVPKTSRGKVTRAALKALFVSTEGGGAP